MFCAFAVVVLLTLKKKLHEILFLGRKTECSCLSKGQLEEPLEMAVKYFCSLRLIKSFVRVTFMSKLLIFALQIWL